MLGKVLSTIVNVVMWIVTILFALLTLFALTFGVDQLLVLNGMTTFFGIYDCKYFNMK
jgi:hypothetical protein